MSYFSRFPSDDNLFHVSGEDSYLSGESGQWIKSRKEESQREEKEGPELGITAKPGKSSKLESLHCLNIRGLLLTSNKNKPLMLRDLLINDRSISVLLTET